MFPVNLFSGRVVDEKDLLRLVLFVCSVESSIPLVCEIVSKSERGQEQSS